MSRLAQERVLLVNDDGINAPGMQLLTRLLEPVCGELWVIAPDSERSGSAHAISVTVPIRASEVAPRRIAIQGTPTDCVILARRHFMKDDPPTLVVSGINRGANLGDDVTYSGTTSAALEATLCGIPAVALSQIFTFGQDVPWATAERFTVPMLETLLARDWPTGIYYNVNFPDCGPESVTGLRAARQGQRAAASFVPERRIDGRDVPYWWICLDYGPAPDQSGTDLAVVAENAISVTPLLTDMTCGSTMSDLADGLPDMIAPGR
ncbi:5'/3'-nucleotidase SurE [Spectribacter hydrogenoxidans]|uniref:5'-nucleotidase SurE n=1 Tax=Spectribacter hydrogenoxidans TaxID=3075608 RepID=A0ABU3C0W6_9GAMM|nr:5'/3'-nucleotidase SurE [Salinisphaera sp. W335]MDT0635197.1 5'/3'-nucleotidase SurE [Salinisphaera sp. W335]